MDDLTTSDATKALSAKQGKVLNDAVTSLMTTKLTIMELTDANFAWDSSNYFFYKTYSVPTGKKIVGLSGNFTNASALCSVTYRPSLSADNLIVMGITSSTFEHISRDYKFNVYILMIDES